MGIDLNADVGEADTAGGGEEGLLLEQVTSANIACGFHAGSPQLMLDTVELAGRLGVRIGAHPGFQDREFFGRRDMRLSKDELSKLIRDQLEALTAVASQAGVRVTHVKPHGALYNMAARDAVYAESIATAVKSFDSLLVLVGLAGSQSIAAAERLGLAVAREGFIDRAYRSDGTLVPRGQTGAVIDDVRAVVERALRLAIDGMAPTVSGEWIRLPVDTICIHGDTPGAAAIAAAVRVALTAAGVTVRPFSGS